ncbi:alpha-1A adrenergic receptor-like [Mizuhopecten yessoensis]|uniref:alpha-1A adrenergic receptor-like n=1 Tax=Mizuhopecten yessoensis TaxID=6573 RepID=UPI000B459D9C|nr:alpha-1A adrenergic receptor-like [Mizuhopecten yessoensis]
MINLHNNSEVNFTDIENNTYHVDITKAVVVGAILSFVICVIIGGNVLVLIAVYANSHLRSTTNYFIVNLACADLLLGITVLPFSATHEIIGYWPFGEVFCEIWAAIDVLWCTGSIITLTAISVDRYIGVTRPLQHSTIMSEKKACYVIIFVWIVSAAISVVPFIGWKEPQSPDPTQCTVNGELGYVIVSASVSFYVPISVIIFVYIRIYKEAVKHSACLQTGIKLSKLESEGVTLRVHTGRANSQNGIPCTYQSSSSSEHSDNSSRRVVAKFTIAGKLAKFKREKKAAQTLGIVVGVFLLCWFPFFFCLPLSALCGDFCHIPTLFFKIIFWLGYCNSMINPIIYSCSSREFQRAFRRILRCKVHRNPRLFYKSKSRSTSISDLNSSNQLSVKKSPNILYRSEFTRRSMRPMCNQHVAMDKGRLKDSQCYSKDLYSAEPGNGKLSPSMKHLRFCESCDSENLSLSDDQMEALKEECLQHLR